MHSGEQRTLAKHPASQPTGPVRAQFRRQAGGAGESGFSAPQGAEWKTGFGSGSRRVGTGAAKPASAAASILSPKQTDYYGACGHLRE